MLARTKTHLLAGNGEQGGTTETVQREMVGHAPARVLMIHYRDKATESTTCQHIELYDFGVVKTSAIGSVSTNLLTGLAHVRQPWQMVPAVSWYELSRKAARAEPTPR
jgi:hypothetical protein